MNRLLDQLSSLVSRVPPKARQGGMLAALLAGLALFAVVVDGHYPLRHWLFFVYARLWLLGLLFMVSSLAAGWRVLAWLLPEPSAPGERLVCAQAVGVLVFVWGLFVLGILGLLGSVVFFAWPAALLLFGGPRFVRDARRFWRRLRPFGARLIAPRNVFECLAAAALAVGLVAIYLQVMTPANIAFDARWYHLPIAEQYASGGRIIPFKEGWFLGAIPQLASLLYMWAYLSPGALFEHVSLASHLEWFLFLATLGGVSVLARRLLGGRRAPYAAAVLFLFPGIFTYDSALATMADHVMAFWGPPLALAVLRLRRWFAPREAVAAALITSGAALTKLQSSYMVGCAVLAVAVWGIWRRRFVALGAFAATGIVATSIHWLKNVVFYGDPIYPFLHRWLPSHPFLPGRERFTGTDHLAVQFALNGTPLEKVRETLKALFTFSFIPHDWPEFHGDRPVFGSLFTLLLPVLLFFRATRELWFTIAGIHLGIVIWFVTSHEDRFLQNLLPWMAAATAALLALAWHNGGRLVRAALVVLVAFQIVWGADQYFLRNHSMVGDSVLKTAIDRLAAGQQKRYAERFQVPGAMDGVTPALPKDAKPLLHNVALKWGIGRPVVADLNEWQLGIDYLTYATPQVTHDTWRGMGVTHIVWQSDRGGASLDDVAREAVFAHALETFGGAATSAAGHQVAPLVPPPSPAAARTPTRLAWFGCGGDPPMGVYIPKHVGARRPERYLSMPALAADPKGALAGVSAAVLRPSCPDMAPAAAELAASFRRVIGVGDVSVWVRRR